MTWSRLRGGCCRDSCSTDAQLSVSRSANGPTSPDAWQCGNNAAPKLHQKRDAAEDTSKHVCKCHVARRVSRGLCATAWRSDRAAGASGVACLAQPVLCRAQLRGVAFTPHRQVSSVDVAHLLHMPANQQHVLNFCACVSVSSVTFQPRYQAHRVP